MRGLLITATFVLALPCAAQTYDADLMKPPRVALAEEYTDASRLEHYRDSTVPQLFFETNGTDFGGLVITPLPKVHWTTKALEILVDQRGPEWIQAGFTRLVFRSFDGKRMHIYAWLVATTKGWQSVPPPKK
jgi:hypothetical protein